MLDCLSSNLCPLTCLPYIPTKVTTSLPQSPHLWSGEVTVPLSDGVVGRIYVGCLAKCLAQREHSTNASFVIIHNGLYVIATISPSFETPGLCSTNKQDARQPRMTQALKQSSLITEDERWGHFWVSPQLQSLARMSREGMEAFRPTRLAFGEVTAASNPPHPPTPTLGAGLSTLA